MPTQMEPVETIVPHENDVLLGRGGKNNMYVGNEQLRQMARARKETYMKCSKKEKSAMSRELVKEVQALSPPGRFLKRDDVKAPWEICDEAASREKCSQCLRDAVKEKGAFREKPVDEPTKPANDKMTPKLDSTCKQKISVKEEAITITPLSSRCPSLQESRKMKEMPEVPPLHSFKRQRIEIPSWEADMNGSMTDFDIADNNDNVHTIPLDDAHSFLPQMTPAPEDWNLFNFKDDAFLEPFPILEADLDSDDCMNPFETDFF